MDDSLQLLLFHLKQLMQRAGMSSEARSEIESAIAGIQALFDAQNERIAALAGQINDLASYHN